MNFPSQKTNFAVNTSLSIMATSIYHLSAPDENNIDVLMDNIASDIENLKEILNNVNTDKDTKDKRREFQTIRDNAKLKIDKVTSQISRSLTREDLRMESSQSSTRRSNPRALPKPSPNLAGIASDSMKYQELLSTYSSSLRDIVETAIKKFRRYKVYQPPKPYTEQQHNERSPLLAPSKPSHPTQMTQQQLAGFESIATSIKVYDDSKHLEDEEEAIVGIHDDVKNMKEMFEELDELVSEQEIVVDKLADNIGVSTTHVVAGKDELEIAERNKIRSRNRKIILLIILIVVLAIIVAFVWAYDRNKR